MKKRTRIYNRIKTYTPSDFFNLIDTPFPRIIINGVYVKTKSDRYKVFNNNLKCVKCGLEGSFFALEKAVKQLNCSSYHFNLYGIRDGIEIMLTKDHIIPKSKGGKNDLSNYQTMCIKCNMEKKDKMEELNEIKTGICEQQ